ncbi:hypothetical protein [Rhizobium sp. FKL33]|uniref:hypothetical protein n=1 Tax=Rhizobium sp. FKL33 TaxID=2562307 RepID=UPI0010C05B26|nr:hypothetical protein [Rhizobium sp. FKL33]
MAAANGKTDRILVCAPMKSGSTFVSDAIAKGLDLQKTSLLLMMARPYDYVALGAGNRTHEIDELALLSACLLPGGFVAHHHMTCSPYLARQAAVYNLKFILMKRNVFDSIVSLDEFCLKGASSDDMFGGDYLRRGLPMDWSKLDEHTRIEKLLDRFLPFYVHYYVSWIFLEQTKWVRPLWISYERDVLGDKAHLAARLGEWLGRDADGKTALRATLDHQPKLAAIHFNKGVAGRGEKIKGANRARVLAAFRDFEDLADCSDILA